jgi:pimeloyl-ACP methyl ester carboxylesterase
VPSGTNETGGRYDRTSALWPEIPTGGFSRSANRRRIIQGNGKHPALHPKEDKMALKEEKVTDTAEFKRTFTHHTAAANNVRLHYVTGGPGDPVVLLHGYAETWYMWRHIMPELAKGYTVIVPDLRGAGDSDKPYTGYDKVTMAEDIYQLVRLLGHERIFLVGHDIGLMVAYAYAAAHPADVRRLALLDAPIPGTTIFEEFVRSGKAWHFAFHNVPNLPESLTAGRERTYLTEGFYRALSYNPAAFTEADIDEYVRSYSLPGGMRAGFAYFRAFSKDIPDNKKYFMQKLPMPILALGGAQSLGPVMVNTVKEVASDVRGGSIERCGHWVADEQPKYVTDQLLAFFGEEK